MSDTTSYILTLNGGSSSIKFAVFPRESLLCIIKGTVDRIGMDGTYSVYTDLRTGDTVREDIGEAVPIEHIVNTLTKLLPSLEFAAIGHRVVFGGTNYTAPTIIDETLIANLKELASFAPRHLPVQIALIESFTKLFPNVPQTACFDTSFYRDMPRMAAMLPLPRKYESRGVRRYGFHGLSYEYLMRHLTTTLGVQTGEKRVLLAHLGSGASLTAVMNGVPVDTSMGFSPTSGIPMGTRSGELDPGLFEFFTQTLGVTTDEFNHMVNFESGLLGISGTTADMEVLIQNQDTDARAAEAVAYFCYHVTKQIGALAATMNGIDVLVFSGGMGEKAPLIRERVCTELTHLGILLDSAANDDNRTIISDAASAVSVYVIPTDEEAVIAAHTKEILS